MKRVREGFFVFLRLQAKMREMGLHIYTAQRCTLGIATNHNVFIVAGNHFKSYAFNVASV